jgi:uncharacterized membrane protein
MADSTKSPTPQQQPIEGEVLSDEDKKKLSPEMQKVVTMMQSYEGPLPPASEFAKYEKVQKGAADRIIGMAEYALSAEIKDRWWHNITVFWSMFSSKVVLVALIGVSVYLIMNGKEIAALLAGIVPLAQIFSNIDFSFGKKKQQSKTTTEAKPAPKKSTKKKSRRRA